MIGDIFLALQPGWSIVVYCDSRECQASKHVAERLRGEEYQFDNVYVLHGGWEVWQKSNRSN